MFPAMKFSIPLLPLTAALLLAAALPFQVHAAGPGRSRTAFDAGWRFQKGDPAGGNAAGTLAYPEVKDAVIASGAGLLVTASGAAPAAAVPTDLGKDVPFTQPGFDDKGWREFSVPHDWAIEGPFDQALPGETGKLPWVGVGWYRKHFTVRDDAGTPGDARTFLDIDGAMSHALVWCNGRFVGGWPYGYTSFRLDLTPHLKTDGTENVLAIRLDNPPASSRWYPGAGLYRHVWLVRTAPVHVSHWGTHVTLEEVSADAATVKIQLRTDNAVQARAKIEIRNDFFEADGQGKAVGEAVASTPGREYFVVPGPPQIIQAGRHKATIAHPKLWDPEHPNLYVAVTTLLQDGKPVDRTETVFGLRTVRFTADNGFLLNGKRVPLQGVCNHHDLGALGTALDDTALRRQLVKLKEMGCNAIRTSHNPPAPELLDLCDRLGLLVMDESFDCWAAGKNPNDYHVLFADWHEKDLRALVRRDRNHPSVILWSIGNEVPDQGTAAGPKIAAELTRIVHEEDGGAERSRPTTVGCDRVASGYSDFHQGFGVMGYNYKPGEYNRFRQANPDQPIISTESASSISSRGFYTFPVTDDQLGGRADFQVSDYGLASCPWATTADAEFAGQDDAPFTGGEFVWTGFDYLGEPTPYNADETNLLNFQDPEQRAKMAAELERLGKIRTPSRSSYFGIIDLAGLPKDRYYLYQARWRPELPMAHLLPHWTWPERVGQVTPVFVYTSGDEAELFLNGESLGRKKRGPRDYRLRWDDVKYTPGEVKVVAYKNGQEWATDTMKTAGEPARVSLVAEDAHLQGHTAFYDATVVDKDGVPVPRANSLIRFSVEGPALVRATDNGDATSHASFQARECRAFNGKCVVTLGIDRGKAGGPVTVRAEAEGLQAGEVLTNPEWSPE